MDIPEACEALISFFFKALDNGILGYVKVPEDILSECSKHPVLEKVASSINEYPEHAELIRELSIPETVALAKQISKGGEFLLMCGMLCDYANFPEKAIHMFSEAEEIAEEPLLNVLIKYEKGKSYYASGMLREALKSFEEATNLSRNLSDANILIEVLSRKAFTAKMLGEMNILEESIGELEKLGNYMSDFHLTLLTLLKAWLEREKGNVDEFKQICESARLSPENLDEELLFAHSIFLVERGRIDEVLSTNRDLEFISDLAYSIRSIAPAFSERLLRRAIEIDPNSSLPYVYLGLLARERGENEKALNMFREALKRNPQDITAYLHAASTLLTMEKIEEAEKYIKEAEKIGPDNPYIPYMYGLLHIKKKDFETAKKYLEEAAQKGVTAAYVLLSMMEKGPPREGS